MAQGLAATGTPALPGYAAEPSLDLLWTMPAPEGIAIVVSAPTANGMALLTSRGDGTWTRYLLVPEVTAGMDPVPLDAWLDRHDTRLPILDGIIGRRPIRDPSPVALGAAPDGTFWIAGAADKGMSLPGATVGDAWCAQVDGAGGPLAGFTVDLDGWSQVLALATHEGGVLAAGRVAGHGWVATGAADGGVSGLDQFGDGRGIAVAAMGDGAPVSGIRAGGETGREHVAAWTYRDGRLGEPVILPAPRTIPPPDRTIMTSLFVSSPEVVRAAARLSIVMSTPNSLMRTRLARIACVQSACAGRASQGTIRVAAPA